MLQILSQQLGRHPDINDWKINLICNDESQWYYNGPRLESKRKIADEYAIVTLYHDENQSGELQRGEARFTLFRDQLSELNSYVEQALNMTRHTFGPFYSLPGPQSPAAVITEDKSFTAADTHFAEKALDILNQAAIAHQVTLAAAEIFISVARSTLMTSKGFNESYPFTNVYIEYTIIARERDFKAEFFGFVDERSTTLEDLAAQVEQSVRYARDSLHATLPRTGQFAVVFSNNSLPTFFRSFIYHSSAQAHYDGLSHFKPMADVLPGQARGDTLTLASDGLIPLRKGTVPFDSDGVPASRHTLIEDGILKCYWTPFRYADILQIPCTGHLFNVDVQPGHTPYDNLIQAASREPLYLIAALSSFEPDRYRGHFSAEIKLGYEISNGKTIPIKGGSVSGNLFTAFEEVYFSQETMMYKSYRGPRAIRFENVTFSGK
ncbi:metallopeptidase TldD-related protein [candidate division CSSED10-310 bacterium]|uniref:Metallopeptidase TldD-related protein n=1 Tax=candidate division CSSED10-310 bacterium TaxID=2855610 RepID=A0ABV6YZL0_UNCC1